jgi:serine/threonine protein kinase
MNFNKNLVVELYNRDDEIAGYLGTNGYLCPALSTGEIKYIKKLGSGVQGVAWLISFKGEPAKYYVMKVTQIELKHRISRIKLLEDDGRIIDPVLLTLLNGGKLSDEVLTNNMIYDCKVQNDMDIISNVDGSEQVIPKGSYACREEDYTEFLLSSLVGQYYIKKLCVNFLDVFEFNTCVTPGYDYRNISQLKKYTFMEFGGNKITSLQLTVEQQNNILIQMLFAMEMYQRDKISHNDLHPGNVFIKDTSLITDWAAQPLNKYSYFQYVIDGVSIYIPNTGHIAKIADWGYGCKYSSPNVINTSVVYDDREIWPNTFTPEYDLLMVLFWMYQTYTNEMALELMKIYANEPNANTVDFIEDKLAMYISPHARPKVNVLFSDEDTWTTPGSMLKSYSTFDSFKKSPNTKSIVTIGKL